MNHSPSGESASDISINFCGYACWGKKPRTEPRIPGREVVRSLLGLPEGVDVPDSGTVQLPSGVTCAIQKVQGCLGACFNHPAALIVHDSKKTYVSASTPDSAIEEIERVLNESR